MKDMNITLVRADPEVYEKEPFQRRLEIKTH